MSGGSTSGYSPGCRYSGWSTLTEEEPGKTWKSRWTYDGGREARHSYPRCKCYSSGSRDTPWRRGRARAKVGDRGTFDREGPRGSSPEQGVYCGPGLRQHRCRRVSVTNLSSSTHESDFRTGDPGRWDLSSSPGPMVSRSVRSNGVGITGGDSDTVSSSLGPSSLRSGPTQRRWWWWFRIQPRSTQRLRETPFSPQGRTPGGV